MGIDRAKMRLYDCEQSAQNDILDNGKEEEYNYEEKTDLEEKIFYPELLMIDTEKSFVDTEKYVEFVRETTSNPSLDYAAFLSRTNANLNLRDDT